MKIQLIWIGKTKNRQLKELTDHYIERIRKFIDCSIIELKEQVHSRNTAVAQQKETRQIIDRLQAKDGFKVSLSPDGRPFTSMEFSELFRRQRNSGTRLIHFILGSFIGLSKEIETVSDLQMSISQMTLTHEMARLLLTEQIYRAFTIINGVPYQK
ncbi:MAG: 23S rRNA (pseudouridine(1915)-N(3))-methyltransferase RlmH [Acidobacteria bacterium]|nr:23S rRNA (pseudouridine(1915)-N(3))-methyltransferase RlmH [Acidobacteriota bacterium]MBI3657139.1 23S rRNA (pseudouridine(1915)-N(3))-methyltransferase RlmH [Acidobacteriota bacterium]